MKLEDIVMRVGKIAVAIALLLFAALLALGEFRIVTHNIASTLHQHVGAILLIALCLCAAYMLLRRPIDPVANVHCPRCRTLGGHTFALQYRGSVSYALLHFGVFLFSTFYSSSRQQRFRCRECKELFHSDTAISRSYRLLFMLLAALILNSLWSELSEFWAAGD